MARAFEAGQAWTFKNAPLAESRVVIGKVEQIESQGWHVSICVIDILLPDTATHEPRRNDISHAPITLEALEQSVMALTGSAEVVEEFDAAYREWRAAMDGGQAGSFIIPVDEIIQYLGEAMIKGHPAS